MSMLLRARGSLFSAAIRHCRRYSTEATSSSDAKAGVVVGFFERANKSDQAIQFTEAGHHLNEFSGGRISRAILISDKKGKLGESVVVLDASERLPRVAAVGLGKEGEVHKLGVGEAFRRAAGTGAKALRAHGAKRIAIDCSHGHAREAAEGATLALFKFSELKKKSEDDAEDVNIETVPFSGGSSADAIADSWKVGTIIAEAQNAARTLAERPANLMTPSIFVKDATKLLQDAASESQGTVKILAHDESWALSRGMGCLLGVAQGSTQPLRFMEAHYTHPECTDQAPLVLVGKGVTFDSGGISIKPSAHMGMMKGDMSGAASVVSAVAALARLNARVRVIALAPLTENMPDGGATKPGDVLTASNGTTVEVDNTDAEGRLILADALVYAHEFAPHTIIDVATLTGAIDVAIGQAAMGAFTPSDELFQEIDQAAKNSGERAWRMPLFPEYKKQIESKVADLVNSTATRSGGACTAAAFLHEFVKVERWLHLDIAGVMHSTEDAHYATRGMTGRPVRTLVTFALQRQHA